MLALWSYCSIEYSNGNLLLVPFVCPGSALQQLCVYTSSHFFSFVVRYRCSSGWVLLAGSYFTQLRVTNATVYFSWNLLYQRHFFSCERTEGHPATAPVFVVVAVVLNFF